MIVEGGSTYENTILIEKKKKKIMTYNALGKSIANYAAPVWSTNASDSSFKKIQTAQNAVLRTAPGAHKMASIDHLHQESLTLRVKDHSDMLTAQYLVNCLEEDHVSHGNTIQEPRPRPMKETPLQTTQLFFLDFVQTGWTASRICTHMR